MNRSMRWLVLGLVAAGLAVSCQPKPKEVKIGVILPMSASGEMSSYARDILNGIYMGVDDVGAKLGGTTIKIIEKDYAGDPANLDRILKELDQEGVIAVIGPVSSTDALAAKSIVNALALPAITPSATLNSVVEGSDYLWRVCASDKHMSQAAAYVAGAEILGLTEVAIVEQSGNPYSEELSAGFKGFCDVESLRVVKDVMKKPDEPICDANTAKDIISAFKAPQEKTCVFVPMYYQDAAVVINELRAAGYKGIIIGGDGWDSKKLPEMVGATSGTNYFITHFFPGDVSVKAFVDKYRNKYQEEPSAFSALGYDAFMVIYNALSKTQSVTREALKEQFQFVSFEGATGKIEFGKEHEPNALNSVVVQLRDGKLSFFKKLSLSPYRGAGQPAEETEETPTETPPQEKDVGPGGKQVEPGGKKVGEGGNNPSGGGK